MTTNWWCQGASREDHQLMLVTFAPRGSDGPYLETSASHSERSTSENSPRRKPSGSGGWAFDLTISVMIIYIYRPTIQSRKCKPTNFWRERQNDLSSRQWFRWDNKSYSVEGFGQIYFFSPLNHRWAKVGVPLYWGTRTTLSLRRASDDVAGYAMEWAASVAMANLRLSSTCIGMYYAK